MRSRSSEIRMGFVPLVDCAPLVVAKEMGLFQKRGLNVVLQREFGWAAIRDKLLFGELDAAHAAGGLSLAMTLGVGCIPTPMLTGLVLSSNGNAIVLSPELAKGWTGSGEDFAKEVKSRSAKDKITLGVVSLTSSHYFLLGEWLEKQGLHIRTDVRIAVLPPPQMAQNLAAGHIQGFCSGAPWGSVAVAEGLGICVAVSSEIRPDHPEKVLLVPQIFEANHSEEHALIREALLQACAYCESPENAETVAKLLSSSSYVKCPADLILKSLKGPYHFGNGVSRVISGFHHFYGESCNSPTTEKAEWLLGQMEHYGLLQGMVVNRFDLLRAVFREDLYKTSSKIVEKEIADGALGKISQSVPVTDGVHYRWA